MIRTEQTENNFRTEFKRPNQADHSKGWRAGQRHSQSGEDFFPTVFYAWHCAKKRVGRVNGMNVYPSPNEGHEDLGKLCRRAKCLSIDERISNVSQHRFRLDLSVDRLLQTLDEILSPGSLRETLEGRISGDFVVMDATRNDDEGRQS